MIFAEKSRWMLKYQKAKAKLVEYDVKREDYPHFPLNSNDLSFSTTYILSRYAESIIEDDDKNKSEFRRFLCETAQYYDAAVSSEDRSGYDIDFLLSGSTAYFFSNNFGSSKVLLQKIFGKVDKTKKTAPIFLTRLLAFLFNNVPLESLKNEDEYSRLNNAVKMYFETGEGSCEVEKLSFDYIYLRNDIL